jgi:tyrosyl-tRNA synthetase
LNTGDSEVADLLLRLTLVEHSDIERLAQKPEQREAQKRLAYELVKLVHGVDAANQAVQETQALFKTPIEHVVRMDSEADFLSHFKNTEIL